MKAPDVLALVAILLGWVLITLALDEVFEPQFIWPLSLGILILGLTGLKFLYRLFMNGWYLPWVESEQQPPPAADEE